MLRDKGVVTHARRLPARFDVYAEAWFPDLRQGRLAVQIRQDLWRRLQHLRGFSPVVEVRTQDGGLVVRAGGSVDGVFPKGATTELIQTLLDDPAKRTRWIGYSKLKDTA